MAKKKSKRTKKKRRAAKKAPFTQADAQRLGYEHTDLLEADGACDGKPNLHATLARHRNLRRFFRRGQLLQQLKRLSPIVKSISHAAIRLKRFGFDFETGQSLRDFLDGDDEAREIWETAEANGWIDNQERLLATAADGNVKAIQLIAEWFSGRDRESAPAADLSRLPQQQVCDLLGVTRPTVIAWEKAEHLPRNGDKSYNLRDVINWFGDHQKQKACGPAPAADRMRDAKAERLELQVAAEKGQLLERPEVIAGLVARAEKLVGAFRYKRRELAMTLHGQTVDQIEMLLGRFFDDLQTDLLEVPESLKLSAEAEEKMRELLAMIAK